MTTNLADGSPEKRSISFSRSALITICAGAPPNQEEFVVHEGIITRSEFFRRALGGNWAEADIRNVNLPEDDPEEVNLYLQYIYTRDIQARITTEEHAQMQKQAANAYDEVSRVYVLAEKFQDSTTKNDLVWKLMELAELRTSGNTWLIPSGTAIKRLYEGTTETSLIRKLLVDLYSNASKSNICDHFENAPKEFYRDLLMSWADLRPYSLNVAMRNGAERYFEQE